MRDAQGNILSVYTYGDPVVNGKDLTQTELDVYGSSRLGIWKRNVDVAIAPPTHLTGSGDSVTFMRGNKLFELTNHLGNVLSTISDKRYGVSNDDSTVVFFNPDLVSANDYYPFGMLQPGRQYAQSNLGGYRYGFNGKEQDNEVKGVGSELDYENRVFDSRLGRFISLDPLTYKYPGLSPYQNSSNNPVALIDVDGLEGEKPKIIGKTRPKLIHPTDNELEADIKLLKVNGLSKEYLKDLIREEGIAKTLYDVDGNTSNGGNATIGIGHLVHTGALGSVQYDKNALEKEKVFKDGIAEAEIFNLFSGDIGWRITATRNGIRRQKITDAEQGLIDVLFDFYYNAGNDKKPFDFYKRNGVFGIYQAIKLYNPNSIHNDPKTTLLSPTFNRKAYRLKHLEAPLQLENFRRGVDDPMRINPKKPKEILAINLIRLSKNRLMIGYFNWGSGETIIYLISI